MRELFIFLIYSVTCLLVGSYFGFTAGLIILLVFLLLSTISLAILEALGVVSFRLETEVEIESD